MIYSQDLQKGLDLGVVSPEILQNFFDLEQYPLVAELIHRFQVSGRTRNLSYIFYTLCFICWLFVTMIYRKMLQIIKQF